MTATTAADLAAAFAWRCDGAKETGGGWMVKCPAHEDSTASLSVTPKADRILVHCFAKCATKTILDTLGLGWDALFVQPRTTAKWEDSWAKLGKVTGRYDYTDAHGTVVHQTVRFQPDSGNKTFRQHRPDPAHPGRWLRRVKDITQVLYHLPQVLKAIATGEPVYLVEGEKDADSLEALGLTATCNPEGVDGWKPHYDASLRGAHLVCLPDFDTGGQGHMANVATRLQGSAASVKLLTDIHTEKRKSDVSDWLAAGHTREQLEAAVAACPVWTPAEGSGTLVPSARPNITLNTEMTRIVDEGQQALLALPDAPVIYQRARVLTVIARGVPPPKWLHRPHDMPVMMTASPAHLHELATQAARWWQRDARKDDWKEVLPPKWFVPTLQGRTLWPFPLLEGIISSPTLRPDGSSITMPGYDKTTGLFLDLNGAKFPAIASEPSLDDAHAGVRLLKDAMHDFPFAAPCHFSAAMAAILSLVCRFAVLGNVPLFAIRANTPGSGKSLLADVISLIGTGRPAPRWPEAKDDEEERKRLMTVALAGYPCLHIDNVVGPLGSPALDLALTSPTYSDRLLGSNDSREVPLTMVWLASGNNMQMQVDMARRVVPIDLDAKMEKPEERTDFKHDPLLAWVSAQRPQLTVAALTIVQAFYQATCPKQDLTRFGAFETWSDLIRQSLVWAGETDPCAGRKNIEAESNPEYEQLAQLLAAWEVCYPIPTDEARSEGKTLKEVVGDMAALKAMDKPPVTAGKPNTPNEWDTLQDALGAYDGKYDSKTVNTRLLGDAFRKFQGKTIAGHRFIADGERHHAKCWRLEQL